jgi:hypothetical protein
MPSISRGFLVFIFLLDEIYLVFVLVIIEHQVPAAGGLYTQDKAATDDLFFQME